MRLFVANIAFTTTEDELERLFAPLSRCLMPPRPRRPLLASTGPRWGDGR